MPKLPPSSDKKHPSASADLKRLSLLLAFRALYLLGPPEAGLIRDGQNCPVSEPPHCPDWALHMRTVRGCRIALLAALPLQFLHALFLCAPGRYSLRLNSCTPDARKIRNQTVFELVGSKALQKKRIFDLFFLRVCRFCIESNTPSVPEGTVADIS